MPGCDPNRIDETLHELTVHCTPQYPFQHYLCHYDGGRGSGFPWHWHREVEMVLVQRGVIHCLLGGERLVLRGGEGVFIQSGTLHGYEAPDRADMLSILFMPEFVALQGSVIHDRFVAPFLEEGLSHTALRPSVDWQAEALRCLRSLHALFTARQPASELLVHADVCALWAQLFAHRQQLVAQGRAESATLLQARLRRMVAYIETRFAQRMTLRDIAQDANVSPSEALRCFRCGLNATPVAYLNQYRLNYARSRLLSTTLTVTDIATESGFSSAAYLDRQFRRAYGVSPTAYRKQRAG